MTTTIGSDKRAASYELCRWDLSELLPEPSSEITDARLAEVEQAVSRFETLRPRLGADLEPAELLDVLERYRRLIERMFVLSAYSSLWFSENTQSREAQSLRNRLQQVMTTWDNRILFFELWWKELDEETAARLLPDPDEHGDERHFLENLRRLRPYVLDERCEQLVNLKDTNGIRGLLTIYTLLTSRLEFHLEVDGERRTLTRDELMSYAFSPRTDLRAAAYRELYRVYEGEADVLGQIYIHRTRDWYTENVELRGFASSIEVRNVSNDVPAEAIEVLLDTVAANAPLFRRYFGLKARWLGLPRLSRYDLYAPLASSEREVLYREAVASVLETFEDFHPSFSRLAERVFAERHIDSETRKGKRGGAFCSTVLPGLTPWVLINYTGRVRDVATLAHELGHAVHSMLAEHHSSLTQHPSLPLAETASVFSEMLMTDRLLKEEDDPLIRRELLATFLDDVYATVLRQAYFVRFELTAHQAIQGGCSLDDLNRLYFENLAEQFGGALDVPPEFQHEWLSIPHLYQTPFYCYAYSFGQLLVLALYRRYQEQGRAFIPGYLKLLSYGGSARPQQILSETGIDITDAAFWQSGFEVVEERLSELERIDI